MFLEFSQSSLENNCARVSFFDKVAGLWPATLLKERLWHRFLPVNFVKFLRTPFLTEHLRCYFCIQKNLHLNMDHVLLQVSVENTHITSLFWHKELLIGVSNATKEIKQHVSFIFGLANVFFYTLSFRSSVVIK